MEKISNFKSIRTKKFIDEAVPVFEKALQMAEVEQLIFRFNKCFSGLEGFFPTGESERYEFARDLIGITQAIQGKRLKVRKLDAKDALEAVVQLKKQSLRIAKNQLFFSLSSNGTISRLLKTLDDDLEEIGFWIKELKLEKRNSKNYDSLARAIKRLNTKIVRYYGIAEKRGRLQSFKLKEPRKNFFQVNSYSGVKSEPKITPKRLTAAMLYVLGFDEMTTERVDDLLSAAK